MASSVTLLGPNFHDGDVLTSLAMRQLTGGTRVADTGTASAVAPLGGVFTGLSTAMQVIPGTGLQVKVNAGYCAVPHPTTGHGVYLFGTMTQTALTVDTADGTHSRIDIVVARVNDLGNSSSDCDVDIIKGTPAASPVPQATPAACLLLAQVLVPTSASSIVSGDITDARTWTAPPGGIIPVANAAAAPAAPVTQLFWDQSRSVLCQGTGTAGQIEAVSFLAAGEQSIVGTSSGGQGITPGTPTSNPWGAGYGQIGGGGGKGGGGAPHTDGTVASEIRVTFTADGTSDYEIAYQWGAAIPADALGGGTGVTAGTVTYLLFLDGTVVDQVVKFVSDSPKHAGDAGTASWYSSAALGTTPSAGTHTATLSVETAGTNTSAASGVFVGDFHSSAGTIFSAPSGWTTALTAENASVRATAVQPG